MRNFIMGLIPFLYSTSALAAPVFITCPIDNPNGPIQFFLNESSDRATGQIGSFNPQYFQAMYNSNQVVLTPANGTGSRWTIDRITLKATQEMYVGKPYKIWWSGQCIKQTVPPIRAF